MGDCPACGVPWPSHALQIVSEGNPDEHRMRICPDCGFTDFPDGGAAVPVGRAGPGPGKGPGTAGADAELAVGFYEAEDGSLITTLEPKGDIG